MPWLHFQDQISIPLGTWDFSFISNRAFFVTSCHGSGSIEIFTFEEDDTATSAPDSRSQPLQQSRTNTGTNCKVAHVTSLSLPPIHPHIQVSTLHTHTGPFMARPPANKPFSNSNEERLHVLAIQYLNPNSDALMRQIRFCIFLKNNVLEGYVKRHKTERKDADDATEATTEHVAEGIAVPWDRWGRENTRYMLHHWSPFDWLRCVTHSSWHFGVKENMVTRYVHGNKVVLPFGGKGSTHICVLDFNVHDTVRQNQYFISDQNGSDISTEEVRRHDMPCDRKIKLSYSGGRTL